MSKISFQPLDEEHLEWARQLHNDPDVLKMLTDPHVVTPEEQVGWFKKLQQSRSSERWLALKDDVAFGVVRLDQIDLHNRSVCVGMDIHKDFRGQGLAKPTYRALFKELFEGRSFNRLWLLVASYNTVARNLYHGLGFVHEGVQRQGLLKDYDFYDYIMMSILRNEYFYGH